MKETLCENFGCMVFNDDAMRKFLDETTYKRLKRMLTGVKRLESDLADAVADGMKNWAVSLGATHYTHWFQPLTNITAGKHDSFLNYGENGEVICSFSGKELQKGEPDASSFPSGGLRATFEARGYTVWDSTSPVFIKDKTLYIPTAFCAYTGESLDRKTPLLKSMQVVSTAALRVLRGMGNNSCKYVTPTIGVEQEYFLIDRALYEKRLDLKIAGRTLFGAKPTKGQELDDHYCGRIRLKVSEYMHHLDDELWKLGVLSKTKHNEVAPAQHELAPLYSSCNIGCDNNQLIMETMRETAKKHGLACLLHEKPFAGVNGSGKHNNWSLSTDDGVNLLSPGKTPEDYTRFLLFLSAVVAAVDEYSDLIRLSAASAGNDHRLGGNEAPPAIISIFLGGQIEESLLNIAQGNVNCQKDGCILKTGAKVLPEFEKDDSDRNRTSPVAFTGNKFEFRMVGSSASIAGINYMINTAIAEVLDGFATRLENCDDVDSEINAIIADTYNKHSRIIFNGNNYTEEWIQEAKRRGLSNITNTVDAIEVLKEQKYIDLFEKHKVFTENECLSRHDIFLETYTKTVSIEASAMLEMAKCEILPSCLNYIGSISKTYTELKNTGIENNTALSLIKTLSQLIDNIYSAINDLEQSLSNTYNDEDILKQARLFRDDVLVKMDNLRLWCDQIETITAKSHWPFPGYTDLLHRV